VKVELNFARKGFPEVGPVLTVMVEGDRQAVVKIIGAVRKGVEEELTELEETSITGRRVSWSRP